MNIKVSIIIPVYNVELWLRACLYSAVNQTLKEIEIICVNDASTDSSLEILQEYANFDSRVLVFTNDINKGLSSSRNLGVGHAQGEYLYFLDSDDMLRLDAMEELYAKAHDENLDVLCFEGMTIFDDEKLRRFSYQKKWSLRSKKYQGIKSGKELFIEMIQNDDYKVVVWILLIKREFYINNDLSFVEGILFEDNIFTFELFLKAERVAHKFKRFYIRRIRESSITTSSFSYNRVYGFFVCINRCCELLRESNLSEYENHFFFIEVDRLLWCCRNEYKKLSIDESELYLQLPVKESRFFKYLIVDYVKAEKTTQYLFESKNKVEKFFSDFKKQYSLLEKENVVFRQQINDIKSGWSFKIGRVITFLPRKIRDFLKKEKLIK